MIIGITGYARSGKTTVAEILCDDFDYARKHIAKPLRSMCRAILYHSGMTYQQATNYLEGGNKEDVIPFFGVSSRYLQVTLGTEWGRKLVSPNIWVDLWKVNLRPGDKVINDSVRFKNEEHAIGDLGGIVIRVVRPGVGPAVFKFGKFGSVAYKLTRLKWFIHPSERVDLISADYTIVNDGTVEDLRQKVTPILTIERTRRRETNNG
jgi:hypothetical protein